ncbi:2'-5' phosphodiesterase of the 2H superfamily [Deinococcus geothermalis DSM 11300]|uniref:2'-5' phosphodiesterase of the 2H superfamily n=1 Tax=Deinococcus geothermalis (strain DSM 11300 / CIP 105573 / AG-3a) TaxID=319795 RepID=Q1IX35_DEIGD|nr:2'-5' RNA ligase family protein [Deinococcus geothermalis]ABF46199.1 2'-5' phosphodiesterase of the 2H superfamily [Deinococcus geothermalis DSM 11300]
MTPAFLLGLLPPPDLAARVEAFRTRLRVCESTPHVTVKARSGLDPGLAWLPVVREVVAASPPVTLYLSGARAFRGGRAVYLAVHSPEAVTLHLRLLEALRPPTRFSYEGAHMTPHLTLVLRRREVDLRAVLPAAQAEFADLDVRLLPFTAREVWLLRKPGPGGRYVPEEGWPLGQG